MEKAYEKIYWQNASSNNTALCASLLNRVDDATNTIDNRLIALDTAKLDAAVAGELILAPIFDPKTGVFTFPQLNGNSTSFDTAIEKIAVNFEYDAATQRLILILADGNTQSIDLRSLISQNEFKDSGTMRFTIKPNGEVTADIINGAVTDKHIRPDYLAELKEQANMGSMAAGAAQEQAAAATDQALKAQSYTTGNTGIRPGEETSNASFYFTEIKKIEEALYDNAVQATEAAAEAAERAYTAANEAGAATTAATNAANLATEFADKAEEAAKKAEDAVSGKGFSLVVDVGNKIDLTTADKSNLVAAINEINAELDETKKSAGNGKTQIAAAITRKKVATAATDTFMEMAGNIDKIKLGSGNATPDKVLQGTTFTGDSGVEQTGTMPIKPIWDTIIDISPDPDNAKLNVYIDNGAYLGHSATHNNRHPLSLMFNVLASAIGLTADKIKHGLNICGIAGSFTGDGTITSDKVLTGYKGYSKGQAVNGGIPANNPVTDATAMEAAGNVKELRVRYPYGYYPKELYAGNYYDPYVKAPYSSVASALNITPSKIVSGQSICGVVGTGRTVTQIATKVATSTVNIASVYANYKNLTADNFFIRVTRLNTSASINNATHISCSGGTDISIIYNSNTGLFSMGRTANASQNSGELQSNANITYDLFIIY